MSRAGSSVLIFSSSICYQEAAAPLQLVSSLCTLIFHCPLFSTPFFFIIIALFFSSFYITPLLLLLHLLCSQGALFF